jgi:membrane associated rhomboid family serine protease
MSSAPDPANNFCYRHPTRQSFVLCQRCGRTVCTDCQTQAAVGVHCPECVREARASIPRRKPAVLTAFSPTSNRPVVTYSIIALCILIYVLQLLPGSSVTQALIYYPPLTYLEPWRMITALFVHSPSSILHVLFNMYTLFVFGPILERLLGRGRFLALYLISGFGGSVAVLWLSPSTPVLGASGAIFGLLAAFFVIQRKFGGNNIQLLILIGINLVIGFLPGFNISWQAHLGGLITGAAVAFVYMRTRRADQRGFQVLLIAAVVVALVALTVARAFVG